MTARLQPLAEAEVPAYIHHRLRVAGYEGPDLFSADAMAEIARVAGGVPRNINNICFNALSLAFAVDSRQVEASIIAEVASDFDLALALSGRNALEKFANLGPLCDEVAVPLDRPNAIEVPAISSGTVVATDVAEIATAAADMPGDETSAEYLEVPRFVPEPAVAEPISPAMAALPPFVQQTRTPRNAPAKHKPAGVAVGAAAAIAASSWTVLRSTNSLTAAAVLAFACIAVGTRMLVTRAPRETSQLLNAVPRSQRAPLQSVDESAAAVLPQSSSTETQAPAGELHTSDQVAPGASLEPTSADTPAQASAEEAAGAEETTRKRTHHRKQASAGEGEAEDLSQESLPEADAAEVPSSPPAPGTEIAVVERDHPSSDVTVTRFFSLDPSFYPEPAREQRVQGIVVLRGTINEAGVFSHVRALTGDHRLVGAAIKAVTHRRFEAGPNRGRGVSADLTLEFRLPRPVPATQTAQAGGTE